MKTNAQKSAYIAKHRDAARTVLAFIDLVEEYVATDAGNALVDGDFIDINAGIVVADLISFETILANIVKVVQGEALTLGTVAGTLTVIENYKNV